ncbi:FAD-dependent oxidoreductase [Leptolyngbya sp. FACHB-261]|uniref:NAD(P)/FAD-dependent oxidoreductase n=1 Tax=Leptolyngbya sp. FACHB-261 TaxID=2692806 RepID=UPI001686305B|nr:FAD-dependent oxidoreductase [Leptolyngbya sp. FACHB-261]MBD2103117.1 FAD-dependent oxidoreductase [Leptolyngbya sp. FACHB-261]
MKVIVVGAGIMGLAAAWALHCHGHQVEVYEQGSIPNPLGSSVDQHRLIRFPYGSERGYTRMVAEAYQAWEQLWADLEGANDLGERDPGKGLYATTGTLVLVSNAEQWAAESAATMEQLGLPVSWLSPDQVRQAFPLLELDGVSRAFHLQSGGVLLAERIVAALAQHLARQGVALHSHQAVWELDPERARLVLADGSVVGADRLVIAAGPWVSRLLPDLAKRVTPSRQVVVYLEPPAELASAWAAMPMVLDIDPQSGLYLVPPVLGTGLKLGNHCFTLAGDPDCERIPTAAEAQAMFEQGRHRLKDFDRYRLQSTRTCFYTVEANEQFILEPVGNAWLMTGFSGHGFKFASVLGLALAETLAGKRTAAELSQWAAGQAD